MKEKDFQGLMGAAREARQILRGDTEAERTFTDEVSQPHTRPRSGFVICLKTDDPTLLIQLKIYAATFSQSGFVRVTDEKGEAAAYPEDFFLPVSFPKEVEHLLTQFAA